MNASSSGSGGTIGTSKSGACPSGSRMSPAELLAAVGLGPRLVARYGEPLLRLVGATG